MGVNLKLLPPKLLYLLMNVSLACLTPYLPLYYLHQGLTKTQVGLLGTFTPLLSFVGCPLWTLLADWSHGYKAILLFTLVVSTACRLAVYVLHGFKWLVAIVCATALIGAPVMPLVDAAVIRLLGENKANYGRQRIFGSIGWGGASLGMGIVVERFGIKWGFIAHAATTLLVIPVVFVCGGFSHLDQEDKSEKKDVVGTSDEVDEVCADAAATPPERPSWRAVCKLFADWQLGAFYLSIFLMGMSASVISNYEFMYLESLGANESIMGLSLAVTCVAELPFFFFSGNLIARFGVRRVLYAVFVCFALRMFLYTLIDKPLFVLPIELLHGVTFGAMWSAGVAYANEFAPPGLSSTTIGLFNGVYNGLGASCGALVGGIVYDHFGAKVLFRAFSVASLVGFVLFFVAQYLPRDPAFAEKEALLGKAKKLSGPARPAPAASEPGGIIASGGYQSFADVSAPVSNYGTLGGSGLVPAADVEKGGVRGWRSSASAPRPVPSSKPPRVDVDEEVLQGLLAGGDYPPAVYADQLPTHAAPDVTFGAACANIYDVTKGTLLPPASPTPCQKKHKKARRRSVTASTSQTSGYRPLD